MRNCFDRLPGISGQPALTLAGVVMQSIHLASDHTSVDLKTTLAEHLGKMGINVINHGTDSRDSCDYPVLAHKLCAAVEASGELGILICGSGIGMSMAANRHKGIRAALCTCEFQARYTRRHNNANVLCLAERVTGCGVALEITDIFLAEAFEGGRHARRVAMLDA